MKTLLSATAVAFASLLAACGGGGSSGSDEKITAELSAFSMDADTSHPLLINHRIPVSFTMSANGSSATVSIPVTFRFVEKSPADPADPRLCNSNSINIDLVADGEPVVVNDVIWPVSECKELAEEGAEVSLQALFYLGEDELQSTITASLPDLELSNGGVDVGYGLSAESSVALLPLVAGEHGEKLILSVGSRFVYGGADPYFANIGAAEIPEDLVEAEPDIASELTFGMDQTTLENLNKLPGTATLTYTMSPASAPDVELPLMIGQENGSTAASFTFSRIEVGTDDGVSHDLYLQGDSLAAVSTGGAYDEENSFTIRGCITTDFTQQGNGDPSANDCQATEVVLARETSAVNAASEITFNRELSRSPGSRRIGLNAVMSTENSLSQNGAYSLSQGSVDVHGKLGKRFTLNIANASAEAELTPARAFYEAQVSAFGDTLYSFSDEKEALLTVEEEFSVEKETRLGGLGFGFGPIKLGFTISAGGRVGLTATDELALVDDEAECQTLLNTEDSITLCGRVGRTVTPDFSMTGRVFGGIQLRIVSAGVDASLRFVDTSFPLENTLGFGITNNADFLVRGNVNWDSSLQLISGKVRLVGRIKVFRFRRSKSVTLFSFASKPIEINLLSESMGTSVKLL